MAHLLATGIDAVNRYRKLEEATAPKDDPAPVYLLDEIADMCRQSPEAAQAIADGVQKKLASRNPVVKFKALRVVKHLCTKGCSQFQRCMQRHSSCVRELVHWRGEPDPFKGDVPNARVREFAKEVGEVMFNAAPAPTARAAANTLAAQGKIQGFGSGGEAMGAGSSSSAGRYGGIGSSGSGRHGGGPSGLPSSIPISFAEAQRAASQLTQAAQQALGEGPLAQGIANAFGGLLQPGGYSGQRLNDGGGYGRDYSPEPSSAYSAASAYAAPAISQAAAAQALGGEEALVEDITTPGGLRPLPDPSDLRRFVDTASGMDGLRVAELLREKLESPRWQVVLRGLATLEAVLQRGSSQACGEVGVMFQSDPGPVRAALQSPQAQVQKLAASVLKLLTGEEVQVSAAAAGSAGAGKKGGAQSTSLVGDLLIDDEPTAAAAASSSSGGGAAAAAPAAAAGGIDDLLGGLLGEPAAAAAPAPAAASNGAAGDMFGGLDVAAADAPAAPAAAPAAAAAASPKLQQQQQAAPLDELFSGLMTSPAAAQPPPAALLGGMSPPPPQQPAAAAPAAAPLDLLGSDLGLTGSKMQQPAAPFVGLGGANNGLLQPQQQHYQQQQQQPLGSTAHLFGGGLQAGGGGGSGSFSGHGVGGSSISNGGGSGSFSGGVGGGPLQKSGSNAAAWSGHDDVSNLMRQVGHGGKYDPAFDFVSNEFKAPQGGGKR